MTQKYVHDLVATIGIENKLAIPPYALLCYKPRLITIDYGRNDIYLNAVVLSLF